MDGWHNLHTSEEVRKFGLVQHQYKVFVPNCTGIFTDSPYLFASTLTGPVAIMPISEVTDEIFKALSVAISLSVNSEVYYVINMDRLISSPTWYINTLFNKLPKDIQSNMFETVDYIEKYVNSETEG